MTKLPFKTTSFRAVMPKQSVSKALHATYYLHVCGTVEPFTQGDTLSTCIIKQQEYFQVCNSRGKLRNMMNYQQPENGNVGLFAKNGCIGTNKCTCYHYWQSPTNRCEYCRVIE